MRRKNFQYLKEHILPLSVEKSNFNVAKTEWILNGIFVTAGKCPCTQNIMDHCVIRNKFNGNTTYVGNICVKRFMEIDARKLFAGFKKLQKNALAKPNLDLIEYALQQGFLYGEHEYVFIRNIMNKKQLSQRQQDWLEKINRRIINGIVVRKLPNENDSIDPNSSNDTNDEEINSALGIFHNNSIGSDAQYDPNSENDTTIVEQIDSELDEFERKKSDDEVASDSTTDDTDDSFRVPEKKRFKMF